MERIRINEEDIRGVAVFRENPYKGYLEKLIAARELEKNSKPVNPVHQIVNCYFELRKQDKMPKSFYVGRNAYPKLAREAKTLLQNCGGSLDDAMWAVSKMEYVATKKGFDWSISTCLKYDLIKA